MIPENLREQWVRLTNDVAVCLVDGIVSRARSDGRQRK